jgi:chromosome segregation ATPase
VAQRDKERDSLAQRDADRGRVAELEGALALELERVVELKGALKEAKERALEFEKVRTTLHERWQGLQTHVEAAITERKELKEALAERAAAAQQEQDKLTQTQDKLTQTQDKLSHTAAVLDAERRALADALQRLAVAQEEVTRLADSHEANLGTEQAYEAQTAKTEEAFLQQLKRVCDSRDATITERDAAVLERNAAREDADVQAAALERAQLELKETQERSSVLAAENTFYRERTHSFELELKETQERSSVLAAQKMKLEDEFKAHMSELYEKAAEVSYLEGQVRHLCVCVCVCTCICTCMCT